jgi:ribosomal-protein-alanine N-acetyltransferase
MLETPRLKLIPLTYEQVEKFRHLDSRLEDELGLTRNERELTTQFRDALIKYVLPWIQADPDNYLFATLWIIVEKATNTIAGDIGFKRKADENGYIEIGYSTQPKYRIQGYMTEAIGALTKWAFSYEEVKAVIAETLETNTASIKVLRNNGFEDFKYSKPVDHGTDLSHPYIKMIWHKLTKDN